MTWGMSINGRPFTTQDAVRLFWPAVRRDVGYTSDRAVADRPRFTPEAIIKRLKTDSRWLYPHVFDERWENGLGFLDQAERAWLTENVEKVRAVAGEIPDGGQPTVEQLDRARPSYATIVEWMGFDRYDDADAFYFGKQIEQRLNPWPPRLDHLRFRTGFDSTEDPALWVWAFVAQSGEYEEKSFLGWASDIRRVVDPIAREFAPEGRAFLRFRSTAEQAELEGAAA